MKVAASLVPEVEICGSDCPQFDAHLTEIVGRTPKDLLRPALPFSVVVANKSARIVAMMGVRFDMTGPRATQYSVVHYADSLRNPAKGDFRPGTLRFVCAEPAYTSLVLRGDVAADTRGRMNLDNLRRMLQIRASLDCVAFEDGQFAGPDTQDVFGRFAHERELEIAFVEQVASLASGPIKEIEKALYKAVEDPDERALRTVARKLLEGLVSGGRDELIARAMNHRSRIPLWH